MRQAKSGFRHAPFLTLHQSNLPLTLLVVFSILLAYFFFPLQADLRFIIPELIGLSGFIIILLSLLQLDFFANSFCNHKTIILSVAVVLRLLFLFRSPELSDDLYRYILDGMMLLAQHNPYSIPPEIVGELYPAMKEAASQVNHPHLPTIYPPIAQIIFGTGSLIGMFIGSVLGIKLLLVSVDICSCYLLIKLVNNLNLPSRRAILFAWHPLTVIEIGGSGHIDGACVFFLFATLLLLTTARNSTYLFASQWFWAGFLMACAILTKWLPLLFLPIILLLIPVRLYLHFFTGLLLAGLPAIIAFLPDFANSFTSLQAYLAHWEFSGFLYRTIRHFSGSGDVARFVLNSALVCSLLVLFFRKKGKETSMILEGLTLTACCYLLFTPTLHPWYALYLVAFLPLLCAPATITFSWSVLLGYKVLILYSVTGEWVEDSLTPLFIVAAPLAAFAGHWLVRKSPFSHIKTTSP